MALRQPRPRRPDHRAAPEAGPAIAETEAQRSLATVDRVDAAWRADIASPANAGTRQQVGIPLGRRQQPVRIVEASVDPVRTAGQRHVTVAVDETGHDRRARCVDDVRSGVDGPLVVGRPQPGDPAVLDEDRDATLEPLRPAVGKRAVPVEPLHGYPIRVALAAAARLIVDRRALRVPLGWLAAPGSG